MKRQSTKSQRVHFGAAKLLTSTACNYTIVYMIQSISMRLGMKKGVNKEEK